MINVGLPTSSPIGSYKNERGITVSMTVHPTWNNWVAAVHRTVAPLGSNGPTAARPVGTGAIPLYVGQDFFDTTLGYKVTIKSLNPTVWVNGAGGVV